MTVTNAPLPAEVAGLGGRSGPPSPFTPCAAPAPQSFPKVIGVRIHFKITDPLFPGCLRNSAPGIQEMAYVCGFHSLQEENISS